MIRALIGCQRGNSFVEMALATPVLVILLVGMVDISRAVSTKLQVVQVAQRMTEQVQRAGYDDHPDDVLAMETEAETAAGAGSNATVTGWIECGASTTHHPWTHVCATTESTARYFNISITKTFTPLFGTEYFPGANDDGTFTIAANTGVRVQ